MGEQAQIALRPLQEEVQEVVGYVGVVQLLDQALAAEA